MNDVSRLQEAYRKTDLAYRLTESKIGCIVALLLVPAGISIDYIIYRDHLFDFFLMRIGCDFAIATILALHFTNPGKKYIKALSFSWLLSVQIMITYMIFITDGYSSSYYAGLNLPIIAIGILLPTSTKEATLFCFTTMTLYVLACIYKDNNVDYGVLYNNVYFLLLTSIISVTSVFFNVRRRFTEFRLSYELNNQNKELAELDRLKSEFFANISHELRTPLTLILAPVDDLIQNNQLPKDSKRQLVTVKENALRLLKLVNDLLEIVRMEEGKTTLKKTNIDVTSLLDGIIESIRHLARKKGVLIEKALSQQPINTTGDVSALEKIFLNIIINAIKFTEKGGHITISNYIDHTTKQGRFEITDTGIGISEPELPYIFDRFRQVDGSSTRKQQGTGLGLALAKELTERHGGTIEAKSTLGKGTTIIVTLPLTPAEMSAEHLPSSNESDALEEIHKQADLSIAVREDQSTYDANPINETRPSLLIVDDEPDMLAYLVNILSKDYNISSAVNGEQAIDSAFESKPDLILLDLMLPKIDGLQVCKTLKESGKLAHTKIILLTARIDESAKLTALKLGADDFLTKPFSSIEVKTRLENLYNATELQRELQNKNQKLHDTLSELQQTQSQLIQSEKLNALGKLSAGLLHEINNPLNYTITAVQLALNDPIIQQDEDLLDTCRDINEGMQRIQTIVSDLRAFAFPTEKQKSGNFKFSSALESALRFTADERKSVRLEQYRCEEVEINGSHSHIVQVLVNLISNACRAIKQADRGSDGLLEIRCETNNGCLYVHIKDNGTGMPESVMANIFDPFYTTQDVGEGMGLGLSICHTIITNHGGKIRVSSEENIGTEFVFELPTV